MSVQTQQIQTIAAGTDILHEGYCSKAVYILLQGRVQVSRLDDKNMRVILAELESGEVFGEMGLISKQPCSATVTTLTEVKVRCLDQTQFSYAMANNIKSVENILTTLFKRMRQMNARVIELEGKLAALSTPKISPSTAIHTEPWGSLSGLTPQAIHALGGLEELPIDSFPFRIGRWGQKEKSLWFGCKEENDLNIHDVPPYGLSRHHCRLEKKKKGVILIDTSRLGTWVDDVIVNGQVSLDVGIHTISFGASYGVFSFELIVHD
ncbi:MAG: cyclic nucleotide-binding domain-containing protein [Mariprofundaceae bacterium]|nr:cyclic nucleotide-binding domain-containing protein [Mariprofundaceae bacterium]